MRVALPVMAMLNASFNCDAPPRRMEYGVDTGANERDVKYHNDAAVSRLNMNRYCRYSTPPLPNAALPPGVASWRSTSFAASAEGPPVISAAS